MKIVPALDEVEDCELRFFVSSEAVRIEKLALKRRIEALAHRIVVAVADRSHRRAYDGLAATRTEGDGRVLGALIGMMDDLRWLTPVDCHVECIENELRPHVRARRPANDASAECVKHDRKEQKAGVCGNVRNVCNPGACSVRRC